MVDAVAAVAGAGVPIIVATGRSAWNCLHTVEDLRLAGIRLVCGNGAVGYDLAMQQITHRDTFDPAPAAHALAAALPGAGFAVDVDVTGFRTTREFPRDFPSVFLDPATPLHELVSVPTTRLICRAESQPADMVTATAAAVLAGTGATWVCQRDHWLDITSEGTTKATGVARAAADLGIDPADVLAIGDDTNDLELFAWAGYAIAMGQAPPAVRAAGDVVTDTVHQDGVAVAVRRWFR